MWISILYPYFIHTSNNTTSSLDKVKIKCLSFIKWRLWSHVLLPKFLYLTLHVYHFNMWLFFLWYYFLIFLHSPIFEHKMCRINRISTLYLHFMQAWCCLVLGVDQVWIKEGYPHSIFTLSRINFSWICMSIKHG